MTEVEDPDAEVTFIKTKNGICEKEDTEENNINEGTSENLKIWRRIPCFGLILIVVKNIIGGAQDVVVKKITGIGKKWGHSVVI